MSLSVFISIISLFACTQENHAQCITDEHQVASSKVNHDASNFQVAVVKKDICNPLEPAQQVENPLFLERQERNIAMNHARHSGFGMRLPNVPHPPIFEQIKKFLKSFFCFLPRKSHEASLLSIMVSSSKFSLTQVSEIEVTLKISNHAKKQMEFFYPNNQRIEILLKDSSGHLVSQWSQDRLFDPIEGFVSVNPDEFILYSEKIPTQGMRPDEIYTLEAFLANQKGGKVRMKIQAMK